MGFIRSLILCVVRVTYAMRITCVLALCALGACSPSAVPTHAVPPEGSTPPRGESSPPLRSDSPPSQSASPSPTPSSPANGTPGASLGVAQSASAGALALSRSVSVAFAGAQAAGATNVVTVSWQGSSAQIETVTDERGNEYLLAVGPTAVPGVATQAIYYAAGIAAGSNVITVNFSPLAARASVRIAEYSGVDAGNPIDVVAMATGVGSAGYSGSVTTYNANDLIVGAATALGSAIEPGAEFTARASAGANAHLLEDRIVDAVGRYGATASISPAGPWIVQMVAFRWAGSPPCN